MRQENNYNEQNATPAESAEIENAFSYLESLPRNHDRVALDSYKIGRESQIIDHEIAATFTDSFRAPQRAFSIPISWTLTKTALLNLLGITSHEGYEVVNGVRFYAGVNSDDQLTLIAVSTKDGSGCNDDLTLAENYPYYDYADPCPANCSKSGNLRAMNGLAAPLTVAVL